MSILTDPDTVEGTKETVLINGGQRHAFVVFPVHEHQMWEAVCGRPYSRNIGMVS